MSTIRKSVRFFNAFSLFGAVFRTVFALSDRFSDGFWTELADWRRFEQGLVAFAHGRLTIPAFAVPEADFRENPTIWHHLPPSGGLDAHVLAVWPAGQSTGICRDSERKYRNQEGPSRRTFAQRGDDRADMGQRRHWNRKDSRAREVAHGRGTRSRRVCQIPGRRALGG